MAYFEDFVGVIKKKFVKFVAKKIFFPTFFYFLLYKYTNGREREEEAT